MQDPLFSDPRLAPLYDTLGGGRQDLLAHLQIASELDALSFLDVVCGTGCFALIAVAAGLDVRGVGPAEAAAADMRTLGEMLTN